MKVTYSYNSETAFHAHIAYVTGGDNFKKIKKYSLIGFSVAWFIILGAYNDWGTNGELSINGESYSRISQTITLVILAPFSIIFGLLTRMFFSSIGRKVIKKEFDDTPAEAFQNIEILFEEKCITVKNPIESLSSDWKLVEGFRLNNEYLYLTRKGGARLASIPIGSFDSPSQMQEVKSLITSKTIHHNQSIVDKG